MPTNRAENKQRDARRRARIERNAKRKQPRQDKATPEDFWPAPRLWPGNECYILGGGPSLALADLSLLENRRVIAVNNAYQLGSFDVCYYGDCRWGQIHAGALRDWPGLKVTCCPQHAKRSGIKVIKKIARPEGISTDPKQVCWNRSSGASAINLATLFGVKRIVLVGFDMKRFGTEQIAELQAAHPNVTRNNWHSEHPNDPDKHNPYVRFREPFVAIKRDLDALGIECVNATPNSALLENPIMSLEEAVRG